MTITLLYKDIYTALSLYNHSATVIAKLIVSKGQDDVYTQETQLSQIN